MKQPLLFVILLTVVAHGYTAEKMPVEDAKTLMQHSDQQLKSKTEIIHYTMDIISADGKVEQTRKFVTYSNRNETEERTLQKFESPPVYEGTGLLIVDDNIGQNDIWLYLPSSRRIRRIAGQEKSNQYMGTEYTYEDFEDYQISEYDFQLAGSGSCDAVSGECHKVIATAATKTEKQASGYTKQIYWIEKKSLYPVRLELYGKNGEIAKVETATGIHQVSGYWRPEQQAMFNKRNGRSAVLKITGDKINEPVEEFYVSKRFLRQ
ncbi:MAG: outer membrane lipoprotein-sorting protein [Exilibacterium sp.]